MNDGVPIGNLDAFERNESYEYFYLNSINKENELDGAKRIVGKAICNTSSSSKYIDDDTIFLHLLMSKFIYSLTKKQRHQFAIILKLLKI